MKTSYDIDARDLDYDDEASRGQLRRSVIPPTNFERRASARRSLTGFELWRVEGAGEFARHPDLADALTLVAALKREGYADVLYELVYRAEPDEAFRPLARPRVGRPRMKGNSPLLYCAFVASGQRAVQGFRSAFQSTNLWELCGYESVPSRAYIHNEFVELEAHDGAFKLIADSLVRLCRDSDPRFGQVIFCDGTLWKTSAALSHHCEDATACRHAGVLRATLTSSPDDVIHAARKRESEWEYFDVTPDEPSRTRLSARAIKGRSEGYRLIGRYKVGGHQQWSYDWSSGLRIYEGNALMFGGYGLVAACATFGTVLGAEVFPADIQEYDHVPPLVDRITSSLGEPPRVITVDRGFTFSAMYEFCTRRGIVLVGRRRRVRGKEKLEDWRTDLFDEDGIPRCRGCGGPGNIHAAGLGLKFTPRGEPYLEFRCFMPFRTIPACNEVQRIPCDREFRLLTGLAADTELFQALMDTHSIREHVMSNLRSRHGALGKDLGGVLPRAGVAAQNLRVQAGILIDLFRTGLRMGWIESREIDVGVVGDSRGYRVSGREDIQTRNRISRGVGSARLDELLRRRRESGIDIPYGNASLPQVAR